MATPSLNRLPGGETVVQLEVGTEGVDVHTAIGVIQRVAATEEEDARVLGSEFLHIVAAIERHVAVAAGNAACGAGNCYVAEDWAVDVAAGTIPLDDVGLAGLDAFSRLEEETERTVGGVETGTLRVASIACYPLSLSYLYLPSVSSSMMVASANGPVLL